MKDDVMEFEGIVTETNKGIFRVQVAENHFITAKLSGKLRLHDIKVIVGDEVVLETSVYDLTLGRITKRFKKEG